MRSSTSPDFTHRCRRCWIHESHCLCAEAPRVDTRSRIVLIRHALEAPRTTNSARIAMLALANAELWEYGGADARFDQAVIPREDSWLLFPNGTESSAPPSTPPRHLIVLDGTWAQARRMTQRIEALRGLPRLALPAVPLLRARLKQAPNREGRSTLEAIADAVALLDGPEAGTALHHLHALFVRRVLAVRGVERSADMPRMPTYRR
jgi:DTW domain-containing protein YfiP